jgi:hypothetical protein
MTPEAEENILDVVNETPGISTRRVSMQVGVAYLTAWRPLEEQQLCPLPSAACTGLVTTRLLCMSIVLPVALTTVWYKL